jgi:hypothetical protein
MLKKLTIITIIILSVINFATVGCAKKHTKSKVITKKENSYTKKDEKNGIVKIADILKNPKKYEGKRVNLVVYSGIRDKDDASKITPLITRSDCYVHDDTGTLLLYKGWILENGYEQMLKQDKNAIFRSDYVTIKNGVWYIKPIVYIYNGNIVLSLEEK